MADRGPVREPDALRAAGITELYDRLRHTGWARSADNPRRCVHELGLLPARRWRLGRFGLSHVLAAGALGPPLLDYFALEDLAAACHAARRWTFLCVIVPLRLPAGTGLPVNPIVLF